MAKKNSRFFSCALNDIWCHRWEKDAFSAREAWKNVLLFRCIMKYCSTHVRRKFSDNFVSLVSKYTISSAATSEYSSTNPIESADCNPILHELSTIDSDPRGTVIIIPTYIFPNLHYPKRMSLIFLVIAIILAFVSRVPKTIIEVSNKRDNWIHSSVSKNPIEISMSVNVVWGWFITRVRLLPVEDENGRYEWVGDLLGPIYNRVGSGRRSHPQSRWNCLGRFYPLRPLIFIVYLDCAYTFMHTTVIPIMHRNYFPEAMENKFSSIFFL